MMVDEVSTVWIIAAANVLLVVPLIVLLIQASRQARAGRVCAEAERIRFQENEQRLRSILDAEPHGILVIGLDYRVLQLNPAGCLLFEAGFPEEIVGTDIRRYIQTNDCLQVEEMHQAAQEGRETCGKWRLVGLSGQIRWVEVTFVPLPASDGTVHAVLSVVRDVTEQRSADRRQALQHAVAKVLAGASTVEQAVPDLLQALVVNLDWHAGLFWRVQGDRQTIACTQDWSVDPTVMQAFMRRSRQAAHTAGSDLPGRCWARGEPLWVEDIAKDPLVTRMAVDETGMLHAACAFPIWLRAHVYGVIELFSSESQAKDWDLLRALGTVGRQIGLFVERTEVEAALHQNEARTSLIIDTALDAVMTMDQTGQIIEWNAQAEQVFGWSAYEVIGRDVADTIFPPSQRLSYREYVQRLLESRDAPLSDRLIEMIGLRRDGREFPVEIAMTPLAVEGSVIFSAFIRDITSRKESEQAQKNYARQLEHVNQQLDAALREAKAATEAKSSFLATMSHEIRTPMNGVIGMTGLLLETALTEEQREYAKTVRTCGDHLLTIINDVLDFSKIEAGKLDLEVIEFDLRLTIDESLDLLAERASSKGLNLACLFHADVPRYLLGDPGRLRQIVMNLTANAIKFTENGDVVVEATVEAQSNEDAMIRIAVTDTGIGISEQARARLFQSFSQADGSTTRKYGGTGLGLAICKRLVEMMGGTIGVMSRVGEGSCFWFTMNLRKQAEGSHRADPSAAVLAGLRILIVDEKAINRRILELMTKKWGMQPTLIANGSEALDVLSGRHGLPRFDLALLDVDMSPTDGIELARAIKARAEGGDPKLVLLTSFGRRGDAKAAKEAGLAAYLAKPIRERQLQDCLVAVITQHPVASGMPATRESPPLITRHTLAEAKAKVDLRILLAEDNIINQKVAVRLFQRLGYRIDVVANGREAVEAVSRSRYDVVFMDCQMPDLDGFEATGLIREHEAAGTVSSCKFQVSGPRPEHFELQPETRNQQRETPRRVLIIALTANAMQGDRERCLAAGMDEYLSKPISVDALAGVLNRVNQELGRSRPDNSQEAA
ncbi:MAG: PAS domain S-box protein [Nitrospira sp.]|nr:PAS domain S-box protein [Nitrospira sp.]